MRLALTFTGILLLLGVLAQTASAQNITRFDVRLKTCFVTGAGTDASVYLGMAGREFNLDLPSINDREQGNDHIYIFGAGGNISNAGDNDPRTPFQFTLQDVENYPIYLRMSDKSNDFPDDNWCVEEVVITLNPGTNQRTYSRTATTVPPRRLAWLHPGAGLVLYVKR